MTPLELEAAARALIEPVFGPCQVTIERAGYTLAQHLEAQERAEAVSLKKPSRQRGARLCNPPQGASLWDVQR
jgi:hypothetical protein